MIPEGARAAARVLILDPAQRLLLLEAHDSTARWWVAPGGGLEPGESFEDAARREVVEEVGLAVELGPWVWTRRHRYTFEGRLFDQYERYFVARRFEPRAVASRPDAYVRGTRWWSLAEIATSTESFTPRRLAAFLGEIVEGRYPARAIGCGV